MPVSDDPKLVLASTSKYRRELLSRLQVPFVAVAPDFDEREYDDAFDPGNPERLPVALATGKAKSVVATHPEHWILGSDQIAVVDGKLLHKPGNAAANVERLMELSGRTHHLITAVALLAPGETAPQIRTDTQALTMRSFARPEAQAYVEQFQPWDCAGGYRIEDAGIRLFSRIRGDDFTGIIGLPLLSVAALLRECGLMPT